MTKLLCTGRPTVQSIDGEPGDMQQQHQTGPTAPLSRGSSASTELAFQQPDKAPADEDGDMSHAPKAAPGAQKGQEAHAVATAADPVANFSFVGENQPAPERTSGDADVVPAEQAVTAKVRALF